MVFRKLVLSFVCYSIPITVLRLVLTTLGLVVIPIALCFSKTYVPGIPTQFPGWKYTRLPDWAWIWDNTLYGTMGNTDFAAANRNPFWTNPTGFMSQYYWLALRNPVNNMEQWKYSSVDLRECSPIEWVGKSHIDNNIAGWQIVWCQPIDSPIARVGVYAMLPIFNTGRALEFRIGFKLNPKHNGTNRTRRVGIAIIINPFKGFKNAVKK